MPTGAPTPYPPDVDRIADYLKGMSTTIDRDWEHLYLEFRKRLRLVFAEAEIATGHPWVIGEGFRSQERQTMLYNQGRTTPGDIVTWMRHPTHHGAGLAADCYPAKADGKTPDYDAPHSAFEKFRAIYQKHGLGNGAWEKGDLGHVELIDPAIQAKAEAWVKAGFPQMDSHSASAENAPTAPLVTINGKPVDPDFCKRIPAPDGPLYIYVRALEEAGVGTVDYLPETGQTRITILQRP